MTETQTLRPVTAGDRHMSLDVLRGLGVMGILAVNAVAFALPMDVYMTPNLSPFSMDGAEGDAWWVVQTFFHYKFVTLFSMLFGVSLLLVGGERSDKPRGALLRRRLGWLTLFGLIHGLLIWYGDILLLYAVTGFVVLLFRSWKPRTLFIVAITIILLGSALAILPIMALDFAPAATRAEVIKEMSKGSPADIAAAIATVKSGLAGAMSVNFKAWMFLQPVSLLVVIWRTGALMMLGMALYKWGFLTGRAPTWVYALLVAFGAVGLWVTGMESREKLLIDFAQPRSSGALQIGFEFLTLPITLGYASLAILLLKLDLLRKLLTPLARLGQMAFTNYISQSIIMTTIFWGGRGLGLYGDANRVDLWVIVAGIWLVQLIWSPLWLSKFSMGPLEWVWRRLAYGKGLARAG
jgi:uncharacterized protein